MKVITPLLLAYMAALVAGHGRLMDPPCRASMWRVGYSTPADYNDNQLFCGGKSHQYDSQGGKCGICGDAFDEPQPRTHEMGGTYYKGILVQNYAVGQEIQTTVQITANHMGFFQFKMCPVSGDVEATQDCLDQISTCVDFEFISAKILRESETNKNESHRKFLCRHILKVAGTNSTDYYITDEVRDFVVNLQLPEDFECEHCVFQWRYHAGNDWGMCPDGTGRDGCGPQEEFYGCADVAVTKH